MAGPWEAFQDATAANLTRADRGIVAPPRAPVQSSPRVWGDAEAQNANIYESQNGPWSAFQRQSGQPAPQEPAPTESAPSFAERFVSPEPLAARAEALKRGLRERALQIRRGPELSPAAQMAGGMSNLVPAASQGTTPHISAYGGNLVSTDVFEDDGGNILYRDPQTGAVVPTNKDTQVALRDPADGVVKVFSRSNETNEGALTGLSRVLSPGLGAGAPTARAAIPAADKIIPRASDTLATAKPFYRAFEQEASRIEVPAATAAGLVDRIHGAMGKVVPRHLADEVYKSVEQISKGVAPKELPYWQRVEAEMNGLPTSTPGTPIAVDHLRDVKELIGQSSRSPDSRVRQASAIASREVNKIISEVSESAGRNLKTADEIYSTSRAQRELQQKSEIAGLRTGRAGYGGNAVNNMRQVLSPIVQKSIEGRTTGFRPNEIAAMREIVEGTPGINRMRVAAQYAPSKGGLGKWSAATVVLPVAGSIANKLATVMTAKQIEKLNATVAQRSPAYESALTKAVERFEKTQIEMMNKPTPNTLGAYVSASRELSTKLQGGGVNISSGDLLRAIQGPMKSAAEEE